MTPINVLLEVGKKKTFASAADWPGWSRSGQDEESSLRVLLDYGSRYARIMRNGGIEFQLPGDISEFKIIEKQAGKAATDFGVPEIISNADRLPFDQPELERSQALLMACWKAFDEVVARAEGKELRKGPRGGGRELEKIVEHVVGAEQGYLRRLGWKPEKIQFKDRGEERRWTREAILGTLEKALKEGLPEQGPRGGVIWPPRYFVRRTAWHVVDHIWEIEDRLVE